MDLQAPLLSIDIDGVLRGQGADPLQIRRRRPGLVEIAARALADGRLLAEPLVFSRRLAVEAVVHEKIILAGGFCLKGPLVAQHLAPAQSVTLLVCSLGAAVETRVAETFSSDPVYSLALDGFANTAVEALAVAACNQVERDAAAAGHKVSLPLNPGMLGWDLAAGQPELFAALRPDPAVIYLNDSAQIIPRKSSSLAIGQGPNVERSGVTCDYCVMQPTCRYRLENGH